MAVAVKLPEISMGVTEATIVRWLKAVGDRIEAGEPLVEVETAKSTVEVEAPASGVLTEILVQPDEEVEVGSHIAKIGQD
ncbi:biotin attachment protein [Altererythrobacter marinus]|jgi:pyruvate/2-oxoglutarate dehydrogenase complex dihydrolipoamide acyltransferase (E2) component|uniref:Biotin attachment protein n=1 Tax=Pelagerythrobacter marinus TaxID=538382 RepID=A0ABW9US58_9SPHN|nr:biotin/lipoyl-containing protein [Pelagerythrobacter marinus]MXO67435.1 biotin attachment protein [Pelagerythrobacter marinus]